MHCANWIANASLFPVAVPGLFDDPQATIASAQPTAATGMPSLRMPAEAKDVPVTGR